MRNVLLISMALVMLPLAALAQSGWADGCKEFISERDFEAKGGDLRELSSPDLRKLPKKPLCVKSCVTTAVIHAVVKPDGSVLMAGLDHVWGGENIPSVILSRIRMMRYAPPVLNKRPVCVNFDFGWKLENPEVLDRLTP
jgi:hypothetical protein